MDKRPFFIIGCGRSGTTSLARILNAATNGKCEVEPVPNLQYESRLAMEGRLADPEKHVKEAIFPRVSAGIAAGGVYGEKNVTYAPFIRELHRILNCRFVFIHRDGRDVVRSHINWHNNKFGTIYREASDLGDVSDKAIMNSGTLPVHHDLSDYGRPRPLRGMLFFDEWEGFNRAQMCAYYWSRINELYLDQLAQIDRDDWISIDYTKPDAETVLRVAEFCGLEGLTLPYIREKLASRINSLKDRGDEEVTSYPNWPNWDGKKRREFDEIASGTMQRLGYYKAAATNWRPKGFGEIWVEKGGDIEWYEWMYDWRRTAHEAMIEWLKALELKGKNIHSLADVGCGLAVGYADHLAQYNYIGLDVGQNNIEWCLKNRRNPLHEYHCMDLIETDLPTPVDLVFSSGTIDNSYDMEAFLEAMVRNSRKWIYLTLYRGWFPDLDEHRYSWNDEHKCFYNDASPKKLRDFLSHLGCQNIIIEPYKTGRNSPHVRYETRVIASVARNPGEA